MERLMEPPCTVNKKQSRKIRHHKGGIYFYGGFSVRIMQKRQEEKDAGIFVLFIRWWLVIVSFFDTIN